MEYIWPGIIVGQAIHAAAKLRIPDLLACGPKTIAELASECGAHPPTLERLLRALSTLEMFAPRRRSFPQHAAHGSASQRSSAIAAHWSSVFACTFSLAPARRALRMRPQWRTCVPTNLRAAFLRLPSRPFSRCGGLQCRQALRRPPMSGPARPSRKHTGRLSGGVTGKRVYRPDAVRSVTDRPVEQRPAL